MRKATSYLICLFLCLLVGASCIDRPDYVLDEDQMIDLLVDVHKAEGLMELQASQHYDQDYQKSIMAAVLVEHGVSRAQYDSSLMWYARHLKQLVRVYSHVDERLMEEYDSWSMLTSQSKDFASSEPGDSVQLWSMRNYLILDRARFADRRFWELESDTNFHRGDTLRWSFDVEHLTYGQKLLASISFSRDNKEWQGVNVNNETKERRKYLPVGQITKLIDDNGHQELSAVPDSMMRFEKAFISVMLIATDSAKQKSPVFLNNISLTRYHCD
mgnify:FL=1